MEEFNIHKEPKETFREPMQLVYGNGTTIRLTTVDLHININVNGSTSLVLAMPLSTAKSMADAIQLALKDYESKSGTEVKDLETLAKSIYKK